MIAILGPLIGLTTTQPVGWHSCLLFFTINLHRNASTSNHRCYVNRHHHICPNKYCFWCPLYLRNTVIRFELVEISCCFNRSRREQRQAGKKALPYFMSAIECHVFAVRICRSFITSSFVHMLDFLLLCSSVHLFFFVQSLTCVFFIISTHSIYRCLSFFFQSV